jgi:sulfite reductase alpha subunit-like flavoprotein
LKSALIIYWSSTRNTEKVAYAIREGLENAGLKVELKKPKDAAGTDFFDYDLVCVGSPSLSGSLLNKWLIFLRANWLFIEIKEKLSRAPLKWKAKTRWFSALILDRTQALMRQPQREKL